MLRMLAAGWAMFGLFGAFAIGVDLLMKGLQNASEVPGVWFLVAWLLTGLPILATKQGRDWSGIT